MDQQSGPGTTTQQLERVRLEAVVARVSTPLLHGPGSEADGPDGAEFATDVEWSDGSGQPEIASELADRLLDIRFDRKLRLGLVIAATTALAELTLNGDVQSALAGSVVVVALTVAWIMDPGAGFSFAEGFVGYRSDMGWPRGVQEDDDVRWEWRSTMSPRTNIPKR